MSARYLINHTVKLLELHEAKRRGKELGKRPFAESISTHEEDTLSIYFQKNGIQSMNERKFISETFLGCFKNRGLIQATLKIFFQHTGSRYCQDDYHLFAGSQSNIVLTYLALFRLEELGFDQFRKFVLCFKPWMMSGFIGFIFNPVTIEAKLMPKWDTILDHEHVLNRVVQPILNMIHLSAAFLQELVDLTEKGEKIHKKDTAKVIVQEPFFLTQPKMRRKARYESVINTMTKARPIPKGLFEDSPDIIALLKKKAENKQKALREHEIASTKAFRVAKPSDSGRIEQLKQQLIEEENRKIEETKIKIKKQVPKFDAAPVKLTTAAILREDMLLRKKREQEERQVNDVEIGLHDMNEFENWKQETKTKEQEEHLINLERRRLEIQLLHEDAYRAKEETFKANREKAAEVIAIKEELQVITYQQKQALEEENRKKVEYVQEIKDSIAKVQSKLKADKIKNAAEIVSESQRISKLVQEKQEQERRKKQELIQKIRELERNVPSVGQYQKEVDFTETSGLGLLGEMSMLELQERLKQAQTEASQMKLERQKQIANLKQDKTKQLEYKLQMLEKERLERRQRRERSLPIRSISSISMVSTLSLKEELVAANPELAELSSKLMARKSGNLVDLARLGHRNASRPCSVITMQNERVY